MIPPSSLLLLLLLASCDRGVPVDPGVVEVPIEVPVSTWEPSDPPPQFVPDDSVGKPWGSITGVPWFRGNPSRSWYGVGPVPVEPVVDWHFPAEWVAYEGMCTVSSVSGETKEWCGSGWTGQPALWERPDGVTEVIIGAYDSAVHFLDAHTGKRLRPDFPVGDIVKGSVSLDPDGYPLLYFGCTDGLYRILALDREEPTLLWALDSAFHPSPWNNDFDSNGLIIDDVLLEGGENGYFYAFKLNRGYDADGRVTVEPVPLAKVQGWSEDTLDQLSAGSIESSISVLGNLAVFTNSGGRVVGLDLTHLAEGITPVVLDVWLGDDIDATPVFDASGFVYIGVERERHLPDEEVPGQLFKLDPRRPDDPIVWSLHLDRPHYDKGDAGIWATPALGDGVLYATTHGGRLVVVATDSGEILWDDEVGFHAWSSPLIIDETLLVSVNCETGGGLRAYDISAPTEPVQLWQHDLKWGCIESTPVVWKGRIYVAGRDGYFRAFAEAEPEIALEAEPEIAPTLPDRPSADSPTEASPLPSEPPPSR